MDEDQYIQRLKEMLANADLNKDDEEKLIDGFVVFGTIFSLSLYKHVSK